MSDCFSSRNEVILGDCLDVLKRFPENYFDAIICDPPAGIGFMLSSNTNQWDSDRGGRKQWVSWMTDRMAEALRVLKPGGYALVWAIPRTAHWTATALEDAGFNIENSIHHCFGSGFPKGQSIGKAIDRMLGAEREVIGRKPKMGGGLSNPNQHEGYKRPWMEEDPDRIWNITAPATPEAAQWEGWNTQLKPSHKWC